MTLSVHRVRSVLAVILQGVERPESVYSIVPQWWHLMVLQYVAASFHLPSVSTANINTVQFPKPHKQYEIPTIPALVMSKVLLPQSNIMADIVPSHSSLFCDVSRGLPTNNNHHGIGQQFTFYSVWLFPAHLLKDLPNMSKYQNTTLHFILLISTDHIFCVLQVLRKKSHTVRQDFFFVDVK